MPKAIMISRSISEININDIFANISANRIEYDLICGLCNDEIVGVIDYDTGFLRYVHDADNTDICDF